MHQLHASHLELRNLVYAGDIHFGHGILYIIYIFCTHNGGHNGGHVVGGHVAGGVLYECCIFSVAGEIIMMGVFKA